MKVYIVQEFFDKDFWFPVFRVCDSLELAKKEADIAGKYDDYADDCIEGIWKKEFSESRGTRWVKNGFLRMPTN